MEICLQLSSISPSSSEVCFQGLFIYTVRCPWLGECIMLDSQAHRDLLLVAAVVNLSQSCVKEPGQRNPRMHRDCFGFSPLEVDAFLPSVSFQLEEVFVLLLVPLKLILATARSALLELKLIDPLMHHFTFFGGCKESANQAAVKTTAEEFQKSPQLVEEAFPLQPAIGSAINNLINNSTQSCDFYTFSYSSRTMIRQVPYSNQIVKPRLILFAG